MRILALAVAMALLCTATTFAGGNGKANTGRVEVTNSTNVTIGALLDLDPADLAALQIAATRADQDAILAGYTTLIIAPGDSRTFNNVIAGEHHLFVAEIPAGANDPYVNFAQTGGAGFILNGGQTRRFIVELDGVALDIVLAAARNREAAFATIAMVGFSALGGLGYVFSRRRAA